MMKFKETTQDLLDFIKSSASMFHAVDEISKRLEDKGFIYLAEQEKWEMEKGGKYYTTRNNSSIVAWHIGEDLSDYHFQMTSAHTDSPTFKVKAEAELDGPENYLRLNTEAYGGMIDSSWFDRPLGLAGRVFVKENDKIVSKLINIDKDILMIPNVAIHLNRDINKGYSYNKQIDLLPILSAGELKKGAYKHLLAKELGLEEDQILSADLFLVNRQRQAIWGVEDEFVSSPKLDNLQSTYVTLMAFLESSNPKAINVYTSFDNEEVGSGTKQGALSTLLKDSLMRINTGLGFELEDYHQAVAKSFMVSCDNAHALHPNHPDMYDKNNRSYLNKGLVIKEAANQKYTTDAFSRAVFESLCDQAQVPYQRFANRSDKPGGSTLGNLSNQQVSLHAIDVGLPQLAMHSAYETGGAKDSLYAIEAFKAYFSTNLKIEGADKIKLG